MGSLAPDTAAALASLKATCAERGLLDRPQGLQEGDAVDGLTDDSTLLRFLQARKMDPTGALEQFESASRFRAEKNIVPIYDSISIDDYEDTRRLYPHWTGRRDRHGLPILFLDIAHLDHAAMKHWRSTRSVKAAPEMSQRACAYFDSLTRFVLPLCTAAADRSGGAIASPVTKSIYLVDIAKISLKQAWDLRDFAREISWILATCYPETIESIYVCNAPSYFATIWGFMKKFVDPVTAAKLVILTESQVYPTLETTIDRENIPVQLGGALTAEHGMLPDLDQDLRASLSRSSSGTNVVLPSGPLKWTENEQGQRVLVATGCTAAGPRQESVAVL
ncbi:SEC14 family lipid-binding protein [Aspergillus homomorphus CBS 101889]|uniref:CRAL/TRIO domain-containing protein n=1 Tax=Aspergillus homomorphus (strain CBS 101889) TaxID=1450537 RepID=A0A395I9C4_ASPHC|nr:CRAL/TRIO domain-containing protein [Aspergillus homomorphus CBS 101889]RAL16767.1 CRAL/TRIO domain-containing protein [Aspergillus homomorphus CBS 101889]